MQEFTLLFIDFYHRKLISLVSHSQYDFMLQQEYLKILQPFDTPLGCLLEITSMSQGTRLGSKCTIHRPLT